jgi:flagellar motor protein MotB
MSEQHKDEHGKEHKKHKKHGHGGHGGGHEEHEEGVPEWIVSFADNALLQMGFFVILLALNLGAKAQGPTDEGDKTSAQKASENAWIDFQIAVREAFNNPVDMASGKPEDLPLIRRLLEKMAAEKTGQSVDENIVGEDKNAQSQRQSPFVDPANRVEFAERSSDLSDAARTIIAAVARKHAGTQWVVEVRGHASALETFRDVEQSRRLSYERAWAVGQALVAEGLTWKRIRLSAAGDSDPATSARARTDSEHASNQRVEIFVLPEAVAPDPYNQPGARPE